MSRGIIPNFWRMEILSKNFVWKIQLWIVWKIQLCIVTHVSVARRLLTGIKSGLVTNNIHLVSIAIVLIVRHANSFSKHQTCSFVLWDRKYLYIFVQFHCYVYKMKDEWKREKTKTKFTNSSISCPVSRLAKTKRRK